jgi:proteasome accessory factor C
VSTEALNRIVELVAELTRRERAGHEPASLAALARHFAVSERQIQEDLRTLTLLGDHADSDWLLSLGVWQQQDRVSVSSQGPFRRPLRFSPEELLAVQLALVSEGRLDLAERIGRAGRREMATSGPSRALLDTVERAVEERRQLRIRYAGETGAPRERTIEPHQVVEFRRHTYVSAWCRDTGDWRRFRLDRIVSAEQLDGGFEPRPDFAPATRRQDLFRATARVDEVIVRFRDGASRWARERYPGCEAEAENAVLVRFQVASPEWLVRQVLEVGADAEVVSPPAYRRLVREAVA